MSMYMVLALFFIICFAIVFAHAHTGIAKANPNDEAHPPLAKEILSIRPETGGHGLKVYITADGRPEDYSSFRVLRPYNRPAIDIAGVATSLGQETLESAHESKKASDLSTTEPISKAQSTLSLINTDKMEATQAPAGLDNEESLPTVVEVKIVLHVSSYRLKANAEEEVQRLTKYAYKPFILAEEVSGKTWFRVYIGNFGDEQEARKVGSELKEKGIISYFKLREVNRDIEEVPPAELPEEDMVIARDIPVKAETEIGGQAYFDFGVFAYEDGDYEDAERNFGKALEFDPDNPLYNHYMGKAYLKMERYQETEDYLTRAWDVNPDMSGLKYDLAFLNYKISNHSRAADLFAEIVKEAPSNVLAHYYAAMSLYNQKHYKEALGYFTGAAERSPSIKANGYYYAGICNLKMGDLEKATERLEYVRDHTESESLREYALKWLEAIDKQKKALRPYSLYLRMGYLYDDNVMLEPLDEDFYADEGDYVTTGFFSGRYNVVNRRDYKMGLGYSHYQTWHDDLEQYDLVGSIFNLYAKYRFDPFTFGLSYLPSYYWVESDSFLMCHQLRPDVMWSVNKDLVTRFSYGYYRNNHFQNNDRDGHTNEVSLDAYYKIGDKGGQLSGGIGYEDISASHPDQYYGQMKTRLGISLSLPKDLNLSLTGKYYEKKYDNVDSFYGVKRENAKYYGSISLSRKLFHEWLIISGEYSYTENDSNVTNYRYNRRLTSFYLTARF